VGIMEKGTAQAVGGTRRKVACANYIRKRGGHVDIGGRGGGGGRKTAAGATFVACKEHHAESSSEWNEGGGLAHDDRHT